MQYPKFLSNNSTIGVPTPSDGSKDEKKKNKYKHAEQFFLSQGYSVILSKYLYSSQRGRSTTAKNRAKELNEMFTNKDIDLILCACGGDFQVECLPYIDFSLLEKNPKIVAGFSDATALLYPITTKLDIATVYGYNFSTFGEEKLHQGHNDFLSLLQNKKTSFKNYDYYENEYQETITGLEASKLTEKVYWESLDSKKVDIEGRIIGGCFDIIATLMNTPYDGIKNWMEKYKEDGIIWYFDNCEMSMEETIRILWRMKECNYFKYARGVVFGRFGIEKTYYGYNTKSCLEDSILKELNIPVIYNADLSHKTPCLPIINGSIAHITCFKGKGTIDFKLQ